MRINLNDPNDFTRENVSKLIASGNDSQNNQMRVDNDGYAYLSDKIGNQDIDDLRFRLETFVADNGYVGEDAARDSRWVDRIYKVLDRNWPEPQSTYIDDF